MSRSNYYLVAALVFLLVGAGFLGQLEFRRTHPYAAQALVPGPSAGTAPGTAAGSGGAGSPSAGPDSNPVPRAVDVDQGPGPNDGKPFPAQLDSLPRVSYLTGAQALTEISKLHGKEIKAASGEIATYGSGAEKVVVWVSVSTTKEEAQSLLQQMLDRMATPGAFSKPELLNMKNRPYFLTTGQGIQHVFYLRGTRIYWVALQVPREKIMGILTFVVNQL